MKPILRLLLISSLFFIFNCANAQEVFISEKSENWGLTFRTCFINYVIIQVEGAYCSEISLRCKNIDFYLNKSLAQTCEYHFLSNEEGEFNVEVIRNSTNEVIKSFTFRFIDILSYDLDIQIDGLTHSTLGLKRKYGILDSLYVLKKGDDKKNYQIKEFKLEIYKDGKMVHSQFHNNNVFTFEENAIYQTLGKDDFIILKKILVVDSNNNSYTMPYLYFDICNMFIRC